MSSKPAVAPKQGCVGSATFDPQERVRDERAREEALAHLQKNELDLAVRTWFKLPETDKYVYHAITSVQFAQVQDVVRRGGAHGLHDWYRNEAREPVSQCSAYAPKSHPSR